MLGPEKRMDKDLFLIRASHKIRAWAREVEVPETIVSERWYDIYRTAIEAVEEVSADERWEPLGDVQHVAVGLAALLSPVDQLRRSPDQDSGLDRFRAWVREHENDPAWQGYHPLASWWLAALRQDLMRLEECPDCKELAALVLELVDCSDPNTAPSHLPAPGRWRYLVLDATLLVDLGAGLLASTSTLSLLAAMARRRVPFLLPLSPLPGDEGELVRCVESGWTSSSPLGLAFCFHRIQRLRTAALRSDCLLFRKLAQQAASQVAEFVLSTCRCLRIFELTGPLLLHPAVTEPELRHWA